jgi:hypothetical protein
MDIEKHFIEVTAIDTVKQVIDKLVAYEKDNAVSVDWLVVSPLGPPWEFSIVEVARLDEVYSADWDKSLEEALGDQFERSNVVPRAILTDEDRAFDLADDSPSQVLIVQDTTGLFMGKDKAKGGDCDTTCPWCQKWEKLGAQRNTELTCRQCGNRFRAAPGMGKKA